nr:hypothetical protein BaRGS_013764 [Batillaria attramentaria]
MRIINSSHWQQALRNSDLDSRTGTSTKDRDSGLETKPLDTPMRKLITKMPEVAKRVFDRCMSAGEEKNPERKDYEITFNFEFLDDTYAPWMNEEYRKQMRFGDTASLSETASSVGDAFDEDDDCLLPGARPYTDDDKFIRNNHPLAVMVSSKREELLHHPLVMALLSHKWETYGRFFYYTSLSVYCLFLLFLTGYIIQADPPQGFTDDDQKQIKRDNCTGLSKNYEQELFSSIGTYVIIVLAAIQLTKEDWQWQLGAVSIFLAWLNLLLFIQKFPRFGIYVVMFTNVLSTFVQFFFVFLLFVVAFGLAFYTLLQQQVPFEYAWKALISTFVMMIGEFDYNDIFNDSSNTVEFPVLSYIIFVAFVIAMSILIMNLLTGLAVDDTKAALEQAALARMAMQVQLTLDVERLIPPPWLVRLKAIVKRKTLRPNQLLRNPVTRFFSSQESWSGSRSGQDKLGADMKKLERNVLDVRETSQQIKSMLRAILKTNNINWQEEDFQEDDEVEQIQAGLSYR